MHLLQAGVLAAAALPAIHAAPSNSEPATLSPSPEAARERAPLIFNAVADAMRQWGSSLHHNGMSFFLATVPEGVVLHHGNNRRESPTDPDWLAYEIEHAEHFARGGRGPPGGGGGGPPGGGEGGYGPPPGYREGDEQHALGSIPEYGYHAEPAVSEGGYLHVYRTIRPLRYLYIDGMGGGKTDMGTLDSQDYLLRGIRDSAMVMKHDRPKHKKHGGDKPKAKRVPGGPMDEQARAIDLCKLAKEWDLSGVIRMEAGFEIIQCDFSDGLEEIQVLQRPSPSNSGGGGPGGRPGKGPGGPPGGGMGSDIEFIRGLSERYEGIGSARTIVDYSSMVSAYFFPVNLTNTDPKRPDLARLANLSDEELLQLKSCVAKMVAKQHDDAPRTIDWQDVTDLIVGRYADRIKYMVEKVDSLEKLQKEISFLLTVFIDYAASPPSIPLAIDRCTNFYLHAITPTTASDALIHTAIQTVSHHLCDALFHVHELVSSSSESSVLEVSRSVLRDLMNDLAWARFKRCPPCAIDEVCLIPMWPMGTVEDYHRPRCTNGSDARESESYWHGGFGRRPARGPDGGEDGPREL